MSIKPSLIEIIIKFLSDLLLDVVEDDYYRKRPPKCKSRDVPS